MKGMMDRATAHAAAVKAVDYWQERFDERAKEFIADAAAKSVGLLWWRKPRGFDKAREIFNTSVFEGGEMGGAFWAESSLKERAEWVAALTDNSDVKTVLLSVDELNALRPVLSPGEKPVACRCKRCGVSAEQAREGACSMSPCPMEPAK